MDTAKVHEIAALLQRAAEQGRLISYQRLHACFNSGDTLSERYRILQDAAESLCDCAILDYGCLMTLDNGLPGDDFFQRFKHKRPHEFVAVMGFATPGRSTVKRRLIAEAERSRVFKHAAAHSRAQQSEQAGARPASARKAKVPGFAHVG